MKSLRSQKIDWIRISLVSIALLYAFFAGLRTVGDFDLGWQIATGRYILQHHSIPSTEVFSYTAQGQPWLYPPLSGVIFYLLYQAGGFSALSWLSALACVGAVALIVWRGSRATAALAIIAVPAIAFRTIPRAELFSTVLFAAFAGLLWEYREGWRTRIWLLPLLMCAWVNLHTGFLAGLAVAAAYIVCELCDLFFASRRVDSIARLRKAAPWLLLSALATLVNPWGWRMYEAIARQERMLALHSEFIGEWSSVHFSMASLLQMASWRDPASADWWILAAALLAMVVTCALGDIGPAIVLAVGAYESISHIRFQALFAILVCFLAGSIFTRASRPWTARSEAGNSSIPSDDTPRPLDARTIAGFGLVALLLIVACTRVTDIVTQRYYLWSGQIDLFGTGPSWWFPERAVAFLRDENLPANVFGDYNLGGYLTWRIGPEYRDYFDGRFIPFGSDLFVRHAQLVSEPLDSPDWEKEAADRDIQTVIFSTARFAGLGTFPLPLDCQSRDWTPVYLDETAVIFVRNTASNADLIHRLAIRCGTAPIHPPAIASGGDSWRARAERFQFLMNSASVEYVLSRDSESVSHLNQAEGIFQDDPNEHLLAAQLALAHNNMKEAESQYRQSVDLRPTDSALYALAGIYATQHRYPEALRSLLQSVAISQQAYDRYRALGKLYLAMNQPQAALAAFQRADRTSPYHGATAEIGNEFSARIAEGEASAYREMGDLTRAIDSQLGATKLTPASVPRWQQLEDYYNEAGESRGAAEAQQRLSALQTPSSATLPGASH